MEERIDAAFFTYASVVNLSPPTDFFSWGKRNPKSSVSKNFPRKHTSQSLIQRAVCGLALSCRKTMSSLCSSSPGHLYFQHLLLSVSSDIDSRRWYLKSKVPYQFQNMVAIILPIEWVILTLFWCRLTWVHTRLYFVACSWMCTNGRRFHLLWLFTWLARHLLVHRLTKTIGKPPFDSSCVH